MQQVTQSWGISFFGLFFFIILLVIALYICISKKVKNRRERVDAPFEVIDERKPLFQFDLKSTKNRIIVFSIIAIASVSSISVIGQIPVHRTNIEHSDPEGDVNDPNLDIISIKSYLNGTELYLQMTVSTEIVVYNATFDYRYAFTIVAKRPGENSSHVYDLEFENGSMGVSSYEAYAFVDGATLTIVTTLSIFIPESFMIGLEGRARTVFDEDYTEMDRDGEVAHLLF